MSAQVNSHVQALSNSLSDFVAHAASSIVAVHSHRSQTSGFVWRSGRIVTADDSLADEGAISVVLPGGETVPASLAGRDPTTDIALLRVDRADLQPSPLGQDAVQTGALAVVVGARSGVPTAALGMVSLAGGEWRSLRGGKIDARLELDVRLRRSSEGGLVLDPTGRAFGMVVYGPRHRVLVIPARTIERVAARLETHGRISRGYLGLGLHPIKVDDSGLGAMVMNVDANGPGAASGVRQGDLIVAWRGQAIRSVHSLLRALGPDSVGSTVRLSIRRAGEPVEVDLTIGERPAA